MHTTTSKTVIQSAVRIALALLLALVLGACQSQPERKADVIISDAHGGGSVLATSPDSELVASGGWAGRIKLWHLGDGRRLGGWHAHPGGVTGLVFVDDGRHLLSSGFDGRIAIWSRQGKLIRQWDTGDPITAMAASADRSTIVTGHRDGSVHVWQTDGQHIAGWPQLHSDYVCALVIDGPQLASSDGDGSVYAWRLDQQPRHLADPPSDARTLLFTDDGKTLLGAGWFRLFRWRLDDSTVQTIPTEHRGIINDLALLPDGRLASISRQTDSAVLILDIESGQTLERLQQHDLCGTSVSPSPDGRFLTTSSDDATVRIWQMHKPATP